MDNEKQYYDVVIEYTSPITVKYKVFAESPKEAAELAESGKVPPTSISKPKLAKQNILNEIVYLYGTVNRLLTIRKR